VDPQPWGGEVVEKWQERNERGGCGEGRKRGVGARTEREEVVEKGTRGRRNATEDRWEEGSTPAGRWLWR
jgi:hypothetical protein